MDYSKWMWILIVIGGLTACETPTDSSAEETGVFESETQSLHWRQRRQRQRRRRRACGDGVVQRWETCDGDCDEIVCESDDPCTRTWRFGSDRQCNVQCVEWPEWRPIDGDGCCVPGWGDLDSDCTGSEPVCGNGEVEEGEICDGDCPIDCDDGDACTADQLIGSPDTCDARCEHTPVEGDVEVCDEIDNDCDGTIDEGVLNACGGCGEVVEICDGIDNNCDGVVDEGCECLDGARRDCGSNVGACTPGVQICVEGAWAGCEGMVGPSDDVCDGIDNDCDATIDEGVLNACGECGEVPVEVCDEIDNDCDATIDEGVLNACGECGEVPVEICDGIDNDCDATIDEGVLNACGGCGEVVEICDGIDNDCDATIDEGVLNACGGCGEVPVEVCDEIDNDCDGTIDEEMLNACGECGEVVEICDGADNDCDGTIDEGVMNACGGCSVLPVEVCDGADNDCDGTTDEGCPTCGNGVVEEGELCDGDCPVDCDDGIACTDDNLVGDAETCDAECESVLIEVCIDADGCCPDGCNNGDDSDCGAVCGDGTVDEGETCDGNCPVVCSDEDICTGDRLLGDAETCSAFCDFPPVACMNDDGCCSPGCDITNDNDCVPDCRNPATWPAEWVAFEDEVMLLTNESRAVARECGGEAFPAVRPVSFDPELREAARCHSVDMMINNFFSHTGFDGSDVSARATAAGYMWSWIGENIAAGYTTPASVVGGWLQSDGHCRNMMNAQFTELGVGYSFMDPDPAPQQFRHYWTQVFGQPR